MRFLICEYLTYENGDQSREVFLLIAALKLVGSFGFGLIFEQFGEVHREDLEPGGIISIT